MSDADGGEDYDYWAELNATYSYKWPVITQRKNPLPDHEKFDKLKGYEGNKKELFDQEPGEGDA